MTPLLTDASGITKEGLDQEVVIVTIEIIIRMKKVIFVPARAGSQRIKNKNDRPFANSTLIEIKLQQAIRVAPEIDIVFNTDSDSYLSKYSSDRIIGVKRPARFAASDISMNLVYEYFAATLIERGYEQIIYLNATSPLLSDKTLNRLLDMTPEQVDQGITTVTTHQEYLWFKDKPLNYSPDNHPRSQDLEPFQTLNFAASVLTTAKMHEHRNIVIPGCIREAIDHIEAFDIDTQWQFEIAEVLFQDHSPCRA